MCGDRTRLQIAASSRNFIYLRRLSFQRAFLKFVEMLIVQSRRWRADAAALRPVGGALWLAALCFSSLAVVG